MSILVTVDTTNSVNLGSRDPSGGWGLLRSVVLSQDPLLVPGTDPVSIEFQFTNWVKGDGRKFTGFRWTHSYTEGHLADANHLGVWYQPASGTSEWQNGSTFSSVSFGDGTMTVVDANKYPYNYLYLLEWTEGSGERYVCDPKIKNQSTGVEDVKIPPKDGVAPNCQSASQSEDR